MKDKRLSGIIKRVLSTFDHRHSSSPCMFEELEPIFKTLGYRNVAVYLADDFPERLHLECTYGSYSYWPDYIPGDYGVSLFSCMAEELKGIPGIMTARLFNHERELGAVAVTRKEKPSREDKEAFDILAQSMSVMAYIERVRTNCARERQERDVFYAQSLTSRLLVANTPTVPGLRTGIEHIRSLDAGGDFFEFIPTRTGGLIGFIGGCNGKGMRTVMEVCSIMREIHRLLHSASCPSKTLLGINHLLVTEQRRAHQASLCVFEIDVKSNRIRLAKAGRLGLLLCNNDGCISNISASGSLFLGMAANPKIIDEEYEFSPGHSLFGLTEGFFRSRNVFGAKPQLRWFLSALSYTLKSRRKVPLVNALFSSLDAAVDSSTRPPDSMLSLSVECIGK